MTCASEKCGRRATHVMDWGNRAYAAVCIWCAQAAEASGFTVRKLRKR